MTATVFERPRWARRERTMELTGVPEGKLLELVESGFVRARKMDPDAAKSACVFCVADVEEWLEKDAAPARFKVLPKPLSGIGGECKRKGEGP